jgi:pimeloyl-ACP methyl ester carboxylesterase
MKIYRREKARSRILSTYDQLIQRWGVDCIEQDVETRYGTTHIVSCGDPQAKKNIMRLLRKMSGARYEIIENAGHGINHEHAQDVNRMIREYFTD